MDLLRKSILLVFAALLFTASASAKNVEATQPKVIGLYFYATWCSSCKVLEPTIEAAQEDLKKEPFLLTRIDVSNKATQHGAGMTASAMGYSEIYEETGLKTGFVILIDAATGEEIGRITKDETATAIAKTIKAEIAKRS